MFVFDASLVAISMVCSRSTFLMVHVPDAFGGVLLSRLESNPLSVGRDLAAEKAIAAPKGDFEGLLPVR